MRLVAARRLDLNPDPVCLTLSADKMILPAQARTPLIINTKTALMPPAAIAGPPTAKTEYQLTFAFADRLTLGSCQYYSVASRLAMSAKWLVCLKLSTVTLHCCKINVFC